MDKLANRVECQLNLWAMESGRALWADDDLLLLAVSGGPDSLALFHLFVHGGLHDREKLVVGHYDHGLRESSAHEAELVQQLCAEWGVRCEIGDGDVAAQARSGALSLEEAARKARYRFLGKLALEQNSRFVLTGHTADDQVETVLMHLLRGSGLEGLRGMDPVRALPDFSELTLVRPLLDVSRAEIEVYCVKYGLQPVHDVSNEDQTFFRNKIRHHLLPILEQYNPKIRERLRTTAQVVRSDVRYLQWQTTAALRAIVRHSDKGSVHLDLSIWRQLPLNLRRRTLRRAARKILASAGEIGFETLEQARRVAETGDVGSLSQLPSGLTVKVTYDALLIFRDDGRGDGGETGHGVGISGSPQVVASEVAPLPVPGRVQLAGDWVLETEFTELPVEVAPDDAWSELIDAGRAGSLSVAVRAPGARMQPLGLDGRSRKLSDMMIDARVPQVARGHWPVVVNEDHVVWLVGVSLDERVKLNQNTRRVIQLRCRRING